LSSRIAGSVATASFLSMLPVARHCGCPIPPVRDLSVRWDVCSPELRYLALVRGELADWWSGIRPTAVVAAKCLDTPDWIERRVETVVFITHHTIERRVTLDLSADVLRATANAAGAPANRLLVPLGVFRKGLLLDFDLRDGAGNAVQVASSRRDSEAAVATMLLAIGDDAAIAALPAWYRVLMMEIARAFPTESDRNLLSVPAQAGPVRMWTPPQTFVTQAEAVAWRNLIQSNESLWARLVTFSLNFMLMTELDVAVVDADDITLKLRYREELGDLDSEGSSAVSGMSSTRYLFPAPGVGKGKSQHLQLAAPEGMFFAALTLMVAPTEVEESPKALPENESKEKFHRRLAPGRGAIYTSGPHPGAYYAAAALYPEPRRFLIPASYSILVSSLLLVLGALTESYGNHLTDKDSSAEAALVLLLAVPTVVSAYLATAGEHEMVSEVHRVPRFLTGVSALLVAGAGGTLACGLNESAVEGSWYGGAGVCFLLFLGFRILIRRIRRIYRTVHGHSSTTREQRIRAFEIA
jgi:hypothetical protein